VNGKHGDNPLSDLTIHGAHPFPADIEHMLLRIDALGRWPARWPLGENWPFSPREFDWEKGNDLDNARQLEMFAATPAGRRIWVNWRYDRADDDIPDIFFDVVSDAPVFVITAY
jgi:hypothetical protein